MQNKKHFITQEASKYIQNKDLGVEKTTILPKTSNKFFQNLKNKEQTIYIYDLGFNKTKKIIPINNHINKTGSNPLCGEKKIAFYDITNIYQKQENGKIAECFGLHPPIKKNNQHIQARFLCHHTIAAYCAGFKKVFAYIID